MATWSLYNAFVPIFLKRFVAGETLIGLIMTLDNIAAITLQPYFGALSDNTYSRFGHRMPFMIIGIPIAALFFALIPLADNFWLLLVFIIIMNLAMSVFRSPTVALMPDLTPSPLRSKANGVVNFMGGVGAILTYGLAARLYELNPAFPFILFSLLLLVILLAFLMKLREPERPRTGEQIKIWQIVGEIFRTRERRILYILMAIFFWFFGYAGVETFFTLYGRNYLLIKESTAAQALLFFSLTFVLFAIPSGILAGKYSRKKIITIGIIGLIVVFSGLALTSDLLVIRLVLLIGGIFWAFININSYPMVVDQAGDKIGAYTGVYYFFSTIPAILAPVFVGFLIERLGYGILFISAIFSFMLALFFILKIKD
ncbi:MAG: MFS transporter [Halanaerobiales bacterium]|nr:MFS transporter [Halanaerobiales bacterium]